jgi:hypothetical protein
VRTALLHSQEWQGQNSTHGRALVLIFASFTRVAGARGFLYLLNVFAPTIIFISLLAVCDFNMKTKR